jgi:chromosome segregation ATPase
MALDSEIGNYKKAIQNEQNNNETLTGILNKVTTEISFLEKQIEKYREKREALIAEFTQYQKTLEATEAELIRVNQESRGLDDQINHLQRENDVIVNETVKVEDQIYQNLQIQKTLEKGASSTEQGASRLTFTVRDKEMQISLLQNELARIRVDLQNVIAQNHSLEDTMDALSNGLLDKDKLVERYEVEIRRRNDEIERKQSEVDRLNKKYDTLMSNLKDENMGPLEATVHNLTNEIAKKQRDCAELQYYWLRSQTELVNLNKEIDRQSEVTSDMERQLTVLNQKQLRIQGNARVWVTAYWYRQF